MKRNLAPVVVAAAAVVVALFASQFVQRPAALGVANLSPSSQTALAQTIPVPPTGSFAQTGISVTGEGRITVAVPTLTTLAIAPAESRLQHIELAATQILRFISRI